jgi:hypothetical protein
MTQDDWEFLGSQVEEVGADDEKRSESAMVGGSRLVDDDVKHAPTSASSLQDADEQRPLTAVVVHQARTPPRTSAVTSMPLPRKDYDSKGNLAVFDDFVEWDEARRNAKLVAAQLAFERKELGATEQMRYARDDVAELQAARERVRVGEGTFTSHQGTFKARLEKVTCYGGLLQYHVIPEGKDPYRTEIIFGEFIRPREAASRQAHVAPSAPAGRAGDDGRPSGPCRAGWDGKGMKEAFDALSRPSRLLLHYQREAAATPASRPSRRGQAEARSALAALERQRECVGAGHGWFRMNGRWVEADVVGLDLSSDDEDPFKARPVLILERAGKPKERWSGGPCRAEALGCCTIL